MYIHGPLKKKEIHRFYSRSIIKNGINFLVCLTCVTFFLSRGIVMQKCFYVTPERSKYSFKEYLGLMNIYWNIS